MLTELLLLDKIDAKATASYIDAIKNILELTPKELTTWRRIKKEPESLLNEEAD